MPRLLPSLVVILMLLLVGCSSGAAPGGGQATNAPTTGADATKGPESGAPATDEASAATTTDLPADCAKGLGDYLVAIEPLVSKFDPAKDTLGALYDADDAAADKADELLTANDSKAPYSCSEVGLEWAYFDSTTPWDAVLAVAGEKAPGTVGYLQGLRATSALDQAKLADYGIDGCDGAVTNLKTDIKGLKVSGVDKMAFQDAVDLLGRYKAYMSDVQDAVCPPDALGNKEFDFMAPGQ